MTQTQQAFDPAVFAKMQIEDPDKFAQIDAIADGQILAMVEAFQTQARQLKVAEQKTIIQSLARRIMWPAVTSPRDDLTSWQVRNASIKRFRTEMRLKEVKAEVYADIQELIEKHANAADEIWAQTIQMEAEGMIEYKTPNLKDVDPDVE